MFDSTALWTVARQAPLSMEFFNQEYWSGLPFPTPGDLPDPGIKPGSPALAGGFLTTEPPGKPSGVQLSYKNKNLPFAATWIDLEDIMLSEISHIEKDTV